MEINAITDRVIAAALKVHTYFGPGLFENVYKECLYRELQKQGLLVAKEVMLPALYHGELIECGYRLDLLVEGEVIVELKAVERLLLIHRTQMRTYLKLSRKQVGLLLNFNVSHLKDGIVRVVNGFTGERPSANSASPR